MADVPSEAPHKVAGKGIKGGLAALKKIPPVGWVFIAAGVLLVALYFRHQQQAAAAAQSDQGTGATADQGTTDTSNYGADTSQIDYLSGYQSGLSAGGGASGGFGGGGFFGSGSSTGDGTTTTTTDTPTTTLPSPTGPGPIDVTVNLPGMPTGGGAPARPSGAHTSPAQTGGAVAGTISDGGSWQSVPAGPKGAIKAPSGHNKPPPKKGYRIVGTGHGGWIYVPVKK